jgi:hypothetical protein
VGSGTAVSGGRYGWEADGLSRAGSAFLLIARCLIPGFDGAFFAREWKEALRSGQEELAMAPLSVRMVRMVTMFPTLRVENVSDKIGYNR